MKRQYVKQTASIKLEKLNARIARMDATIQKKVSRLEVLRDLAQELQKEIDSQNVVASVAAPVNP